MTSLVRNGFRLGVRGGRMGRRMIGLVASVATLGLLASAAGVSAQRPGGMPGATTGCAKADEIRIMIFASLFNNMVTYIGEDAGFFKKHCLNARLIPVNTGPAGLAQLQSGSLHFSDSSFDNVLRARAKGLPIKAVVGESAGVPYSLVVRKGLPLENAPQGYPAVMKDLLGKKIGVFGLGTGSEYFVRALLRSAGLDPNGVTFIAVGSTPTQLAALENGAVDAVIMADPAQDIAVGNGYGSIIVDLRKSGVGPKEIQGLTGTFQVKVGAEAFVRENPDIARRYVKANEEAVQWIRDPANFEQLVRYMRERVKLGQEVPNGDRLFANLVRQYIAFSSASISRRSVEAWNAHELAAGTITSRVTFEDVVWSGAPVTD
jgi:ABC-type nitrate/sulfonate/bicarbonate transport system substrate-binding protein